MAQLSGGLLLGVLIGFLAWRVRALSASGAWAAALTGGLVFGLGGLPWAVLLLAFFTSSSLLSQAFAARKIPLNEKYSKGSQRDWGQVLANGGLGVLLALVHALFPGQVWPWWAYAGAMAAVNADTWATELGVLSAIPPRLVTTWKAVERGTSGGVTAAGTLAALGGAALIGLVAALCTPGSWTARLALLLAGTLAGLLASLVDSLLGATVQAIYHCPACHRETEQHPMHLCGTPTTLQRGWPWLNNDGVNFICSIGGALVMIAAYLLV